jgi:hypothetical protein
MSNSDNEPNHQHPHRARLLGLLALKAPPSRAIDRRNIRVCSKESTISSKLMPTRTFQFLSFFISHRFPMPCFHLLLCAANTRPNSQTHAIRPDLLKQFIELIFCFILCKHLPYVHFVCFLAVSIEPHCQSIILSSMAIIILLVICHSLLILYIV